MTQRHSSRKRRDGSGALRQLPSGRWQARFRGPDGVMRPAGVTFDTKLDAGAWLAAQAEDVDRGTWAASGESKRDQTLRDYAGRWLATRDLKPRTRSLYRDQLDRLILPALGDVRLSRLTPTTVRTWHASLSASAPTQRAHAYSLLRAIYSTAVADDLVEANPCRIRGAGQTRSHHEARPATLDELDTIVEAMPDRYRAAVLLAAWCGLRFGELTELRRGDVDVDRGTVAVRRGVVRVDGEVIVGDPKTSSSRRDVAVPPHVRPALAEHLARHVGREPGALLFAARHGGHLAPSSLYRVFYPARDKAGRPDLRWHDLRHTGATLAAATGASLAELQARLGHTTVAAAMRYQHAAQDRDQAIAEALSDLASASRVVPFKRAR